MNWVDYNTLLRAGILCFICTVFIVIYTRRFAARAAYAARYARSGRKKVHEFMRSEQRSTIELTPSFMIEIVNRGLDIAKRPATML